MTQVTFKCINKFHNWQRSGNTFHNGFFANVVPNGEDPLSIYEKDGKIYCF